MAKNLKTDTKQMHRDYQACRAAGLGVTEAFSALMQDGYSFVLIESYFNCEEMIEHASDRRLVSIRIVK